ncbi:EF-hand domain-containing protein [Fulvimonas sp. R45]|uniref:EF-hand domain-containing protein n=1 Tax=Fulvimonas sp. R45 TaxID=3045937 RepID=UPI00265F3B9C|nr:EF-hand domain-containing protein [Fulvimonas sp. R45]MDO1530324.1 EF-hand domain-containing protein [Fulvimonas sp. R45]
MKFRKPLLASLVAGSLLMAGAALAQDQQAATPPPSGSDTTSATFNTAKGQVTVNSAPGKVEDAGPAPDFAQLSGGKKSITPDQAAAYPPLANDFEYADSNRDGHISKAEYQRWASKMH